MTNSSLYPRTLGLFTLAYGIFTASRPTSLLGVAGLEPRGAEPSASGRTLGTLVGARDSLSGLAMLLAPAGPALQAAVLARVACDASDVVGFGVGVPAGSKAKVVAVAAGWGVLCATSLRAAGRLSG